MSLSERNHAGPGVAEPVSALSTAPRAQRRYSDSRPEQRAGHQAPASPATTLRLGPPPGLTATGSRRATSESSRLPPWNSVEGGQTAAPKLATDEHSSFGLAGCSRSRSRSTIPEEYRHSVGHWLNCVPEDAEMSVDRLPTTRPPATPSYLQQSYYGSLGYPSSVEVEQDDELSEEEEEWLVDEELAKDGLYRGNYKNLVLLYTFVPLTTVLAFVFLALLPIFAFRSRTPSKYPYPPYLPFPIPEILTSTALWSLSYLLRDTIYASSLALASYIPFSPLLVAPAVGSLLAATLQSASTIILRQMAIPILLVPLLSAEPPKSSPPAVETLLSQSSRYTFPTWENAAFGRVWWIALGWAAAEAIVGIKQGYENVALYKDVLVSIHRSESEPSGQITDEPRGRTASLVDDTNTPTQRNYSSQKILSPVEATSPRREDSSSLSSRASSPPLEDLSASAIHGENQPLLAIKRPTPMDLAPLTRKATNESERLLAENEVEQDLDALMRLKSREELEEVYGIPFIRIPVFISCLHRVNSILSSLGVCLLLTGAYLRSTLAFHHPSGDNPSQRIFSFVGTLFHINPPSASGIQSLKPSGVEIIRPIEHSNRSLQIMFWTLLLLQTTMSLMHTTWVLPRMGVHTSVYVGLLVWLGVFFGALGYWEVLS